MRFVVAGANGEEQRSPVSQSIDRTLEAEPIQRESPLLREASNMIARTRLWAITCIQISRSISSGDWQRGRPCQGSVNNAELGIMLSGVSAVAVVQRTRIRLSVVAMTDTPQLN